MKSRQIKELISGGFWPFEATVLSTNYVEPNGARRETEINDLLIPLGTKPTNADLTVAHR